MTRKRKAFSADFETTTDPNDCRVWAYGWVEIGNSQNMRIGNDMNDFMSWLEQADGDVYFHNLKFDGSFIVNWLLHNGFTHVDKLRNEYEFTCVISGMGQWYKIDIGYGRTKNKLKHTVIMDSLKKLPFKVKEIAKGFQMEMAKGEIDYHKYREIGYEIDSEELEYIRKDIEIVANALLTQFENGLTSMTTGRDSMEDFKSIIGKKMFKKKFPIFTKEMDDEFRLFYKGGFTWVNPKFKGKVLGEGLVYDVNSLYPSIMYDKLLPVGTPIEYEGEYEQDDFYPLYLQHIQCEFYLKKDKIPTIQIKKSGGLFKKEEYLESSKGYKVDLHVTNVDWELIKENYELVDVTYVKGWKFRGEIGLFNEFIDKWMEVKINNKGAKKLLAKLMLNSLYGKFATNPDITGKVPFLKPDGSNGFYKGEEEFKDPVYTPMGAFITAWARDKTIRTAQACYDRFAYGDTDSIHLVGTELPVAIQDVIDDDKLGYWAHESTFVKAKYLRAKTYCYITIEKPHLVFDKRRGRVTEKNHKFAVKCAGMNEAVKEDVNFDNFEVGFTSPKKLRPKQVMGGVVLENTTFMIKREMDWIVTKKVYENISLMGWVKNALRTV